VSTFLNSFFHIYSSSIKSIEASKLPIYIMVLSGGGGGGGGDHQCCYREQLAFNIYSKFCEPKLYRLATKGDWDLIPARCKSHPKEATFRHKYAPNDTALHRILRLAADGLCTTEETVQVEAETTSSSPPSPSLSPPHHQDIAVTMKFNAIQAIVKAHPSAASIPDAFGRTPLHLACMDVCSASDTAVLQLLLMVPTTTGSAASSSKAAVSAAWLLLQDVEKRTPLHYLLARSNGMIPLDALQVLLQACPEAALVPDVVKETPPDIVTRRGNDGEIENIDQVLAMLQQYSTA
jgi:hypothetical protein